MSERYVTVIIQRAALDRALRMKRSRRDWRRRARRAALVALWTLGILAALLAFRWFFKEEEVIYPDPVCEWCGMVLSGGVTNICDGSEGRRCGALEGCR
ncbi:MAG: hypothetical protein FWG50_05835 [Kiritimatiellaeota bacterium]|nr:hypothetical protein [Kiritimatiellota bacterium]